MTTYSSTSELFRILKVRNPTDEQTEAAERVLNAASLEIDAELDRPDDADAFSDVQLALVDNVALNRAADLWRHTESQPGILGGLDDVVVPSGTTRYSWERYAQMLAPLKSQWGIA